MAGRFGVLTALMVCAGFASAQAQDYPSRPVTIVVPYAAGGTVDILARIAAEVLQNGLKQSFVVENRTGAGGTIGNATVARSAPDGYTLLHVPTAFAIVPAMYKTLPYDPLRDFRAVGMMGNTGKLLVVSPSLNVNTVQEFIALAKSGKPINFASPGIGTPEHLLTEAFSRRLGIQMQHVPYGGSAPALVGIMSGDANVMFTDIAAAVPLIQAGKIKALGALTEKRHPSLPDLPAVAETVPGFVGVGWQGVMTRAGTPDAIVDKLNATLVAWLKTPAAAERMRSFGVDVTWGTPKEMDDWVASQIKLYGEMVKAVGIQPE